MIFMWSKYPPIGWVIITRRVEIPSILAKIKCAKKWNFISVNVTSDKACNCLVFVPDPSLRLIRSLLDKRTSHLMMFTNSFRPGSLE